jgi:hypothetical protein
MAELAGVEIRNITGFSGADVDVVFTAMGLSGPGWGVRRSGWWRR